MINRRISSCLAVAFAVASLMIVSSLPAAAQGSPAQPQVLRNPEVNYPLHFDISPPLRDMAKQASPSFGFHEANPVLYPHLQQLMEAAQRGEAPVADGALQKYIGPLVSTAPGLNLLGVGNGFPGYSVPDAPPDTNMAVGDTQVVEWVNVSYAVFDKTTGAIIPVAGQDSTPGNALWKGFGGLCEANNDGDIIAQWDKIAHRWVMTQNVFVSPYATCIAVSTTNDATGSYYRFAYPQSQGFPDYPKWGLMPDAYYQANNAFGSPFGVNACAYERAKLLVGNSSAEQICIFDSSNGTGFDDSMLPADLDSPNTLPPEGQPEVYVGSIDNGVSSQCPSGSCVFEYLFHVDFAVPSNSTFTGTNGGMPIPGVASFSLLCPSSPCVKEPGGNAVDSLGDRLMYRLAYRNFAGDHQTWLVNHAVTAGSSGGERWYEFHAPESSTSLSVFQQGTFAPDSSYRWMGSIAMDQNQDIALGYSVSSSSVYPSIYYTGRVPSDPAGTMESEALIVAGTGSQTDTSNRWGDYSSMSIDQADDCTFWYTQEYIIATGSFNWSTRLASFKFSNCGAAPGPNFTVVASPSPLSVAQGGANSYTVTVTPADGFTGSVNLTVSGLPSGASGSFSPNPVVITSGVVDSTLTVNAGSAAVGTYGLTITGQSGALNNSSSAVLVITPGPGGSLSPTSVGFGNVVINTASTVHIVTLTSNGGAPLNIASVTITGTNFGDFAQTNNCVGTLNVGKTCKINVTFTPSILGAETATLDVNDNAGNSPQTAALSGTGIAQATLTPASGNFGNVAEGTPSAAKNFTLTNNQSVALNISSITTSNPDYAQTNTCGGSVAAHGHCTISVTFTPSILGTETGTLMVNDSASNSPQTASMTGTGVVPATLMPTSANFGNVPQGTPSTAKNFTLTNNAVAALSISSITTSNPDYTQTNTCGSSLAGKAHCTISVTFTPSNIGTETGTLTVTDGALNSPQTASLTGVGIAQATVAPTSMTFAAQKVGTTSAPHNATLKNNLTTSLTISSLTFSGANAGDYAQTNNCGSSLAAKSACTISVTFTPTATGSRTATLNVNDSANNSPQTVSLTGTGK